MAAVQVQRRLFTVEEFARLGEAGILADGGRVELIDGEIREVAPMGPLHAGIVDRLAELLITRLAGRANVRIRNPIRLDRRTEPQPDLAIARRRTDYYSSRHPEAGDLLLVIEVADADGRPSVVDRPTGAVRRRCRRRQRWRRQGRPEVSAGP